MNLKLVRLPFSREPQQIVFVFVYLCLPALQGLTLIHCAGPGTTPWTSVTSCLCFTYWPVMKNFLEKKYSPNFSVHKFSFNVPLIC